MFISQKTLAAKAHLDFSKITYPVFERACNNLCFEIEQTIKPWKLENYVVGKIIQCKLIPDTHLHNCIVDVGDKKLNIICGAPNARKGIKVVVALVGAVTADGRKIERKEVRGVVSEGMICGYNEVSDYFHECLNQVDANGIMELDNDAKIGDTNVSSILGFDETIYELSIPTNRNDQAGAYFVESDFAAYFKTKCNLQVAVNNNKKLEGYNVILDNKLSQYSSLIKISGVKHKMPSWKIKRDLLNNGVKIGCLTRTLINEITYNTGIAPLFFACDAVPKTIKQRYAKKGETITIKGVEYTLDTKDIVLVDDKDQIIALDGIEVADGYGVSPDKTEIMLFISNTYFAFPRNTAIRLGISTYVTKFSKYTISKFQCNLFLRDLNKKFKNVESTNLFNEIEKDITLNFDANECVKFIGTSQLTRAKVIQYIKQWKFKYDAKNKTVTVPGWRTYLENQWDLFEEVLKFFTVDDLESIPVNTFTNISSRHYDEYYFVSKLREMLNYAHILEAKTYNLTSKQELQNFNIFDLPSVYEVNPCSNTARQFMRLSTINELVKVMNYNASHKVPLQPVFELQKIYSDKFYYNLTILAPARVTADHINEIHFNFNTFGLKGILEKMCNIFNCELDLTKANNKYLYPTDTLAINYKGELIGYIGAIKSSYLKQYKLANEVLYVLTINIDKLIANYTKKEFKFKPISNVLPTFKDITVDTTTSTDINKMSQEFATLGFIEKFKFIKAYQIDDATMAYTIRFALINDLGSTLTKEEIDADIKQIVAIIKKYKGEVKGM